MGAEIGVVCDARAIGEETGPVLNRLAEYCTLGIARVPMTGRMGYADWLAEARIAKLAARLNIDVLHGHGAEGGAYARLAAQRLKRKGRRIKAVHAPHDSSFDHPLTSALGRFMRMAERRLLPLTDGLIFDSRFARQRHAEIFGAAPCPTRIVPPGLHRHEFYESMLDDDAADFIFIGELSKCNGIDIFFEALAAHRTTFPFKAVVVGNGPEEERFKRAARKLGLASRVTFTGRLPTRTAFARARCVVVPARTGAFSYVVLEAAAARMPLIASDVGAMRDIVGEVRMTLVPPGDAAALAGQMRLFLAEPKAFLARAAALQDRVAQRFTVESMIQATADFYVSDLGAGAYETQQEVITAS